MYTNQQVFVLFVLCCLIMLGCWTTTLVEAKKRPTQVKKDKAWQAKKSQCEQEECAHLIPDEAYNCVNNCTSIPCYNSIFASNPLEDGEVDYERNRAFTTCLRKEQNDDWQRHVNEKLSE